MTAAETVGQVFLGVRLQCARCHNHPFDVWTQDDYYGLAAYFGNVARKEVNNVRRDKLDKHEINGDEIIYLVGPARDGPAPHRRDDGARSRPRGPQPDLGDDPDALDDLADWLTRDNPQFARNLANRVWFHLMGRGVVEPVDDFRDSNPPSNPALLDALTDRPRRARDAAQAAGRPDHEVADLSARRRRPTPTNADDEANFARAAVRLLPAEVLLDAIGQALGRARAVPERPAVAPRRRSCRASRMGGAFLKIFGKPDRLLTCECERSESTTLAQAFQMINGEAVRREAGGRRQPDRPAARARRPPMRRSSTELTSPPSAASRPPPNASAFLDHVRRAARSRARRGKTWPGHLINSKEFLLRH